MLQVADISKTPLPAALLETITVGLLDDTTCRDWLLQYFHGDLHACPHCEQSLTSFRQQDAFRFGKRVCCKSCGRWFDHRTGTVLAATTLTAPQILLLALLLGSGRPLQEIATRLGLHETTVRDWRDRLSLPGQSVSASRETG